VIQAFTDDHLDDAAGLLAARHRRHRAVEALLPVAYEEPAAARVAIEDLLGRDEADGVAATRGGRLVGYLIGIRKADTWGPNVWVEPAGHAAEPAEEIRDLYAVGAAGWVDAGRKAHYVVVPASDDELVRAWFRLGFGQQHAYGIRDLPDVVEWPEGVREAEERDVAALMALAPELQNHQREAPVFSGLPAADQNLDDLRKELLEDIASPTIGPLVAEKDGRVVGNLIVCPLELSEGTHYGPARPEHTSFIPFAVTDPRVRGSGTGLAMTQAAFAWARARGYDAIVVDWRVTNLLASRFWTARGFRPTFLRLHRLIA
jgi:ribosomal protein S18 acetylase RimI-like enzyme